MNPSSVDETHYFFESGRHLYWLPDQTGGWISLNESQFKRILRKHGVSPHIPRGDYISPLEDLLIRTQQTRTIHYAGPLAGHRCGPVQAEEKRVLVTDSPRVLQPIPGYWPTLWAVFSGLLHDEKYDQLPYFYGWLATAYRALLSGVHRPGQALVLAGERGCGKSLAQNLVTLILGGRSARPYQYMAGMTAFNSDLFGAEHLMIEDEHGSTDLRSRRNFGTQLKSITVNRWQRCHGKNRAGVTLAPFWRVSITVNDEPENLLVLPPMDDSMEDKLILLRASRFDLPMPTVASEDREAFWQRLVSELPYFLEFLTQYQIPTELQCDRFGVRHFHHPRIVEALGAVAPETRLLRMIDSEVFPFASCEAWESSASALERYLTDERSKCRPEARKLFSNPTACGVYLGRLQKRYPERFKLVHTRNGNRWLLSPPQRAAGVD